ncbi:MAG: WD40/YVTN/BNR-like repeat-containing protein [Actinomycetota bacterium]
MGEVAFSALKLTPASNFRESLSVLAARETKSEDWTAVALQAQLRDVQFTKDSEITIVSAHGIHRANLADLRTWDLVSSRSDICRLAFLDNQKGFVSTTEGVLLRTEDGGRSLSETSAHLDVDDVRFPDSSHGWVAGADGIASTIDGGETWNLQTDLHENIYEGWNARLDFLDSKYGAALFLGTEFGLMHMIPANLFYTRDAGQHWTLEAIQEKVMPPSSSALPLTGATCCLPSRLYPTLALQQESVGLMRQHLSERSGVETTQFCGYSRRSGTTRCSDLSFSKTDGYGGAIEAQRNGEILSVNLVDQTKFAIEEGVLRKTWITTALTSFSPDKR